MDTMTMDTMTTGTTMQAATSTDPMSARRPIMGISQFRTAVNDSFVPLQVTTPHAGTFTGIIDAVTIDDVHLTGIRATDHTVERTPALIARDNAAFYKIGFMLDGTGLLVQDGRDAVLRPGDLAIYDTSRPYSLTFDADFRTLVIMVPRGRIGIPALAQLTAVPFRGDDGVAGLVGPFLRSLAGGLDRLTGTTGRRMVQHTLDLLSTTFCDALGQEADPHRAQLQQIDAFIDDHLGDPDLSPGMIADAHFISVRHLHGLFQHRDATVSNDIKSRRLERCHRDLLDPAHTGESVAAIFTRWGFTDPASFGRAFKAAFAVSPGRLRASA